MSKLDDLAKKHFPEEYAEQEKYASVDVWSRITTQEVLSNLELADSINNLADKISSQPEVKTEETIPSPVILNEFENDAPVYKVGVSTAPEEKTHNYVNDFIRENQSSKVLNEHESDLDQENVLNEFENDEK